MPNNAVRQKDRFKNFQDDIRSPKIQGLIKASLNPVIDSVHAFTISAERAVELKPDLLGVDDPDSLVAAIVECASYGFFCDSEHGYLEVFSSKVSKNPDVYQRIARYELQAAGIRAIGMRNGIIINAQCVHQKDKFEHHEGDDGRIVHELNWSAGKERGAMYCAYAIFKRLSDGLVLHREVMDEVMIENAKEQSRNPKALMWTKFKEEGWKKTVIRRGSKTITLDAATQKAARQVDRHYDFDDTPEGSVIPNEAQEKELKEGDDSSIPRGKASTGKQAQQGKEEEGAKANASGRNEDDSDKGKSKAVAKKTATKKAATKKAPAKKAATKKTKSNGNAASAELSYSEVKKRMDELEDEIFEAEDVDAVDVIADREAQFLADYDTDKILSGMIEMQRQNLE